jgi:single-stranded-DNA-specific exonuclease
VFSDVFEVGSQKLLKDKHLKLTLRQDKTSFSAIRFNSAEPAPERIEAAYRLDINEWNGLASVQLLIEDFRAAV